MKKLGILFSAIALIALSTSCERCATCTFNDPDSGLITDDFCNKGRTFEDQKEVHEDNGWSCKED